MRKHFVIAGAIVAVLSAIVVLIFLRVSLLPLPASAQARPVDTLFRVLFSVGGVILVLVVVFLLYSVAAFRRRPRDLEDGPPVHGHTPLETAWTLIPLAIVVFFGIYGALVLRDVTGAQPDELEVRVTSMQWAWRFEYPQYGVTAYELGLPAGRPVLFRLDSRDVIHSFWVPEFRLKQDAVPGMETQLRITPTRVGQFELLCAELCGTGHAYMRAPVTVLEKRDFAQWVEARR